MTAHCPACEVAAEHRPRALDHTDYGPEGSVQP